MVSYIKEKDKVRVYSKIDEEPFEGFILKLDEVGITAKSFNNTVRFYPYTGIYYVEIVKPHIKV